MPIRNEDRRRLEQDALAVVIELLQRRFVLVHLVANGPVYESQLVEARAGRMPSVYFRAERPEEEVGHKRIYAGKTLLAHFLQHLPAPS